MSTFSVPNPVKAFMVQSLACFDSPQTVADGVQQRFGFAISRQLVERYDPTRAAGNALSLRWREVFRATRQAYRDSVACIPIAHRAVRLRALQRMADRAEEAGNIDLAADLLKQAAREMATANAPASISTGVS